MKYIVSADEVKHEVEIKETEHGLKAVFEGKELDVDFASAGDGALYSLIIDGESYRTVISHKQSLHSVYTRGYRFEYRVEDEQTHQMRAVIGESEAESGKQVIKAPMPGLVTKLLVGEGDPIAKGQGVIIIEAMKMENELKAKADGSVEKLHVKEGENVEKNQVLLEVSS